MIRKIDSTEVVYLKQKDKRLSAVIDKIGDLEYELYNDWYEFLVFTIISQMLSNDIGNVLFKRLQEKCDGRIIPTKINDMTDEELLSIGISKRKANAINMLTKLVLSNPEFLGKIQLLEDEDIIDKICSIHGIGPWTAKMFLIFALDRMDILPYEDGAFISAFSKVYRIKDRTRDKRTIRELCKKWSPYSSVAARYLYRFYDSELKHTD